MAGVMTYNGLHAAMFADAIDTTGSTRLLDLGGLAPYFSLEVMKRNAALHTTFAFAPDFADSVRQAVTDAGVADRADVVAAETAEARIDGPFDLVFVNHVIHRFTAEENAGIFRNARASAQPGAKLAVLDFFLDDDPVQRRIDALHAAEYLVIDGTVVYRESEVRGWLEDAGWKPTGVVALPGSPRVLLAEAV
jgi:cyclopropane fatty-acyl-phospholipid synthase-like methyltransferase